MIPESPDVLSDLRYEWGGGGRRIAEEMRQ